MQVNRNHKDTVFRDLFGAPERRGNALSLYGALGGTARVAPEDIEITTLGNALYLGVKNDVSFLIEDEMVLWEHQSIRNPNMPLRGLTYFARLYSSWVGRQELSVYGSRRIMLPAPRYVVFYIGEEKQPDREVMRLSDSYAGGERSEDALEVVATVLNINAGHNSALMAACEPLAGYARLVELIREGLTTDANLATAVDTAVLRCIDEGVLADYLGARRSEVTGMFLTEYDNDREMRKLERQLKREAREAGLAEGRTAGLAAGRAEGRAAGLAEGRAEGELGSLRNLIANTGMDAQSAMAALGIAEDSRPRYAELLAQG